MLKPDVVVAGGGISGLLIASSLASVCSVLLIEQRDYLPSNKYWLTDQAAADENPFLAHCVDRRYDFLDFVAHDGLSARLCGSYCLWDTGKLINELAQKFSRQGGTVRTGVRLYSISQKGDGIVVRANSDTIQARLLIDCMGFGSPLVGAKGAARISGYYVVHGREVCLRREIGPVGLDNVIISQRPAFFELFPTSKQTAHAAVILPCRQYVEARSLKSDLDFILLKSHYAQYFACDNAHTRKSYFGIIPVGRLVHPALDRIIFFGEAGQANPAASATGLSRMLRTFKAVTVAVERCLLNDTFSRKDLRDCLPRTMTTMNRLFQETLFESLLSFNSDDFRSLILEIGHYPNNAVNDLIFAEFEFSRLQTLRIALDALRRPRGILGRHFVRALARYLHRRGSF